MKFFTLAAALLHLAVAGHVQVKMPFLNSAGVTYVQGHEPQYAVPAGYVPNPYQAAHYQQQVAYEGQNFAYQAQVPYQFPVQKAPVAVGLASVPVKTSVAVPTIHHVPAVADVPVTKYEAQPALFQKVVDVAKPAIKTRKFEVRRPAIQKQFYDIEERILVRPVGSALLELNEPLSKAQKGPAFVSSLDDHHQQAVAVAHHEIPVAAAPAIAIAPQPHTVAITPLPHAHVVSTVAPALASEHQYLHQQSLAHAEHQQYLAEAEHQRYVAQAEHQQYLAQAEHQQYLAQAEHQHYVAQAPIHVTSPHTLVSSTPASVYDDSVVVEAAARNAAAKHSAYAQADLHNAQYELNAYSNGAPHESVIVNDAHHVQLKSVEQLNHEEAQDNQQKLIKLLTARGGVAEVGFEKHGHLEPVGDAGISRARVLSATPSPHHPPVEEKYKTRRIVVSRPVQTVQEIDVVEPATKIEQVAFHEPGYIKTAKVGYERIHTSVPVLGKSIAPAITHAQVPVEYYHH